jgi:hypothetical protein
MAPRVIVTIEGLQKKQLIESRLQKTMLLVRKKEEKMPRSVVVVLVLLFW